MLKIKWNMWLGFSIELEYYKTFLSKMALFCYIDDVIS